MNLPTTIVESAIEDEVVLGKGSFGEVVKIVENGQVFALKKIEKLIVNRQQKRKQLKREVTISKSITHQNIIKFHQFSQSNPKYYTIKLEYFPGQSLRKYLLSHKFSTQSPIQIKYQRIKISLDYINALAEVSSKMILNRDIKPDNILVRVHQNGNIQTKMIDFGEAKFSVLGGVSYVGTGGFMAPEVFFVGGEGEGEGQGVGEYGEGCDMWSLGWTLYEIFQGTRPDSVEKGYLGCPFQQSFHPTTEKDFKYLYSHLIYQGINLNTNKTPKPFRHAIRSLLTANPADRLTQDQLLKLLVEQFNEISPYLKTNTERASQQMKLIESIAKLGQAKLNLELVRKAVGTIRELYAVYIGVYRRVQEMDKAFRGCNGHPVLGLIVALFLEVLRKIGYIMDIMNLEIQDVIEELLVECWTIQEFKDHEKYVSQLINKSPPLKQLQEQVILFINTYFPSLAPTYLQSLKKYIFN